MQKRFIEEIAESIAGKPAKDIVNLLFGQKNTNEFLLAKKLNLTINQTRNLLYRLADQGIVSFTRKKDKKKGWYTYFWTLEMLKSLEMAERKLEGEKESMQSQLKNRKKKRFYECKSCQIEVSEERALLNNFTCIECGQVYSLKDDAEFINQLESSIQKIDKELLELKQEIEKEKSLLGKKRTAKENREKRKKKQIREKEKKKKIRAMKRLEKKTNRIKAEKKKAKQEKKTLKTKLKKIIKKIKRK